jgi:SOS-response transcriptional repressor LexA
VETRRRQLFTTITTEGAILPADLLTRIAEGDRELPGLTPEAYHLSGEKLGEAISRSYNRMLAAWATFEAARAKLGAGDAATSITREKWLLPLFSELGYGRLPPARAIDVEGKSYPVSHLWQNTAIHLVGCGIDLDRRTPGAAGAARMSPHGLVQELLNRSRAHLWGFVSNGLRLRVLRDNVSLTRQAFVEFDLEAMMRGEVYADFALLWLVCHQSRIEAERQEDCWLEKWSRLAAERGTRALDDLRRGVAEAITALGCGFLAHPRNRLLRDRLQSGELSKQDYYRQLLRLVYRLLFLFVAEDRGLLLDPAAAAAAKDRYMRFYSTARIRKLAERRRGTAHADLYRALALVMEALDSGCPALGLPALGSFLWSRDAVLDLASSEISNRALLDAVRALAFTVDGEVRRPVDYWNLGSEELGSVYESLLELHADVNVPAAEFRLEHGGRERRATGSHYTPTSILRKVLDFALEPAIAQALAAPDPEAALLSLRVLDPACGSGHFLVAAAHRIARALARLRTGDAEPAPEAMRSALRAVVGRCLYGVDVNPMAVELCKVALWMETLEPGKPLAFLEHRIQCGDSLLGVPLATTVERLRRELADRRAKVEGEIADLKRRLNSLPPRSEEAQGLSKKLKDLRKDLKSLVYDTWPSHVPDEAFKRTNGEEKAGARKTTRQHREEKKTRMGDLFRAGAALSSDLAQSFAGLATPPQDSIEAVREKERRLKDVLGDPAYERARLPADAWCAAFFWNLSDGPPPPTEAVFHQLRADPSRVAWETLAEIRRLRAEKRFFHFELAFPEVFAGERPGFDVVIGNPPYLGGLKISTNHGDDYLRFLKANASEAGGTTDLCAYFFRRGFDLLGDRGHLGFLGTNTIAQGDTRAAALGPITGTWGGTIVDAVRSMPWEGVANLEVAIVHLHKGDWRGTRTLDGREVRTITPMLDDGTSGGVEPVRLRANANLSFIGSFVLGMGFVLTPEEAQALIARDSKNRDCLFPYLNGEDLNSRPDQSPSRWVINFFDWPLERVPADEWRNATEAERRAWERLGRVAPDYEKPVAADYPDLLAIVRETVKSLREQDKRESHRRYWWQYAEKRPGLHRAIRHLDRINVVAEVTKYLAFSLVSNGCVYSHTTVCVPSEDTVVTAILNSNVHHVWVVRPGVSTLETRIRYTPSDYFETFPFPCANRDQVRTLRTTGACILDARRAAFLSRRLGLTKLYNLLHDPATEADSLPVQRQPPPFDDIRRLRSLHVELDRAVLDAYGWSDIDPRHGFYTGRDAGPGVADDEARFTIHPEARAEILKRLLALNHERAAEEKERLERGEAIPSAFSAFEVPPVVAPVVEVPAPAKEAAVLPFRRVRPRREDRYRTCVPLLSLKAAAGGFSDDQTVDFEDWVEIQTSRKLRKGMFVAQVVGRSMEPRIPDGSYCLFSYPVVGTRQGRIVLAQHRDIQDPDTGGAYTLKVYESEKVADDEGGWRHSKIILKPLNPSYQPIVLKDIEEGEVAVIAEFVEVLEAQATESAVPPSPSELDLSALAGLGAGAWATPAGVTEENLALFAALDVLRVLGKDSDPERVRLAAILVRRPALALPFMTAPMREAWMRVVGTEAKPIPANVIPLDRFQKEAADTAWGKAVLRLKATGNLAEDKSTGRWSPTPQLPASGQAWVEGRARVVASLLRDIELAKAEQNLVAFVKDIEHGAAGQAVS